jgi:hypothetical protein
MKRISQPIILSAFLLSVGCVSAQQPPRPEPTCKAACTVHIIVPAGCGSGIQVAPEPITVPARGAPFITWTIMTPGWSFGANGIDIVGITTYAARAFPPDKENAKSATSIKLKHVHVGAAAYKYDINLVGPDKQPCKLDPTIVDQ